MHSHCIHYGSAVIIVGGKWQVINVLVCWAWQAPACAVNVREEHFAHCEFVMLGHSAFLESWSKNYVESLCRPPKKWSVPGLILLASAWSQKNVQGGGTGGGKIVPPPVPPPNKIWARSSPFPAPFPTLGNSRPHPNSRAWEKWVLSLWYHNIATTTEHLTLYCGYLLHFPIISYKWGRFSHLLIMPDVMMVVVLLCYSFLVNFWCIWDSFSVMLFSVFFLHNFLWLWRGQVTSPTKKHTIWCINTL
jgi:hypothetical protein